MDEIEVLVDQVELLLAKGNHEQLTEYLDSLNISDVEALIDQLPEHATTFISSLSINRRWPMFLGF